MAVVETLSDADLAQIERAAREPTFRVDHQGGCGDPECCVSMTVDCMDISPEQVLALVAEVRRSRGLPPLTPHKLFIDEEAAFVTERAVEHAHSTRNAAAVAPTGMTGSLTAREFHNRLIERIIGPLPPPSSPFTLEPPEGVDGA